MKQILAHSLTDETFILECEFLHHASVAQDRDDDISSQNLNMWNIVFQHLSGCLNKHELA